MPVERVDGKVADLDLVGSGDERSVRRAETQFADHAAAETQIRTDPVTAGRLDYKNRAGDSYIFEAAVFERYLADIEIVARSFEAAVVNRKPYAGDIDAAGFGAEGSGVADPRLFHVDYGDPAATVNVDVLDRDALEGGVRRHDLSGFRAGDGRGGNAVR